MTLLGAAGFIFSLFFVFQAFSFCLNIIFIIKTGFLVQYQVSKILILSLWKIIKNLKTCSKTDHISAVRLKSGRRSEWAGTEIRQDHLQLQLIGPFKGVTVDSCTWINTYYYRDFEKTSEHAINSPLIPTVTSLIQKGVLFKGKFFGPL